MPARACYDAPMTAWVRRFPFPAFYLLALAIASSAVLATQVLRQFDSRVATLIPDLVRWLNDNGLYVNILNIARYGFATGQPAIARIFVFAGAPTLAALTVTGVLGGGAAVQALLGKFRPLGPGVDRASGLRLYAGIFAVYFLVLAGYLMLARAAAGPGEFEALWAKLGGSAAAAFLTALWSAFADEGGTLEELGWRGFAWPLLMEKHSPLAAALMLGILWTAWHLPREIPALVSGGVNWAAWLQGQAQFAVTCVSLSVVAGYLTNKSRGSVLPAILVHGGTKRVEQSGGGARQPAAGHGRADAGGGVAGGGDRANSGPGARPRPAVSPEVSKVAPVQSR